MDISQLKPATPGGANGDDEAQGQEAAAKRAQEEQMKRDLLSTVLESDARERCKYWPLLQPQTWPTDCKTIRYFSIVSITDRPCEPAAFEPDRRNTVANGPEWTTTRTSDRNPTDRASRPGT
jgi:hypothetical protein